MFDVAIVGGDVVDGTGAPRYRADVGIKNGRISTIGTLSEGARLQLDARGKVVAPGFIDVHTHFDAQVVWDPYLTPSPLHGVTTAVAGNCGFTLAPMEDHAETYLTEMLARVEGIPLGTLRAGVDITWRTFEEYLARVDGNVAINVGFLVGHSTVRRVVMGDDFRRTANEEEIAHMERLVDESLAAGALGFSSSLSDTHNDGNNEPIPSRFATDEEILRLCATLRPHSGTWLEFLPWATGPFPDERAMLMAQMSATASRPLNWNLLVVRSDLSDIAENRLAASDVAAAHGGLVQALTLPMPMTMWINLDSAVLFDALPAWADVLGRERADRVRLLADSSVRRRLVDATRDCGRIWYDVERLRFDHVDSPAFADVVGRTVADAARLRGVDAFDLLFDVALADDLHTTFVVPAQGDDADSWRLRVDAWHDPRTIVGGSDAGAHLDMLDGFAFFTDFIGPTVRDRQLLPLETAVRMVTDDVARAIGLTARGRLGVGYAADIVVFDEAEVAACPVEVRGDLPGNGYRLYSAAKGIDVVLVNGEVIVEQGEFTGARPGTVLRSGRDTATVPVG
jgi:N-acyl-D-aspartate/D-glutamate deacylase